MVIADTITEFKVIHCFEVFVDLLWVWAFFCWFSFCFWGFGFGGFWLVGCGFFVDFFFVGFFFQLNHMSVCEEFCQYPLTLLA